MSDEPARFDPNVIAALPAELALGRLPPGRHGLPRAFVDRSQRLRIVAAMLRILPQEGYAGITIGHLIREASVSRTAFYRQFSGKEDCFLATYDLTGEWLCRRIEEAVDPTAKWPMRVRAGVVEVLQLLAANPALAHLIAVDVLAAGAAARERQRTCLARLAKALRAGRPGGAELPQELEEMLLGGIVATIGRHVDAGRTEQLPEAAPEVVRYLLMPYLDQGELERVARAA